MAEYHKKYILLRWALAIKEIKYLRSPTSGPRADDALLASEKHVVGCYTFDRLTCIFNWLLFASAETYDEDRKIQIKAKSRK